MLASRPRRIRISPMCSGQPEAVAALEVAAVGGHHVAMVGRPGVGKTLLAQRLPTILPDLDDDDALSVTAIRSVVADVRGLIRRPPFEAPHHTATVAALVGGGRGGQPTPGAITRAHAGVLFLDEAAEFGAACLESLRQPLESGVVSIARAGFTARMPARFQLVLAANPCPCGLGDGAGQECTCSSADRRRYRNRLSGPLLDRVDIRMVLGPPGRARGPTTQRSGLLRSARAGDAGSRAGGGPLSSGGPSSSPEQRPVPGGASGTAGPQPGGRRRSRLLRSAPADSAPGERIVRSAWRGAWPTCRAPAVPISTTWVVH